MISNYYTLSLISRDLDHLLKGATVDAIFSQNKNELVIATSGSHFLVVSCDPSSNHAYLRSSFSRAKRNTMDLFPRLLGNIIRSVSLHPSDRELTITTDKPGRLLIHFYGSKANVLLVDHDRTVLDAFLHPKDHIASKADVAAPGRPFPSDAAAFQAQLSSIGHLSAFAAFKAMAPLLGSVLVREIFVRTGLNEHAAAAEVTAVQAQSLFQQSQSLLHELTGSPSPRIYKENNHPVRFSIVELRQHQGLEAEGFESVHQAIRVFLSSSHRDRSFHVERDRAITKLRSEKDRIERTTAKISSEEQESSMRAERFDLSGKLLMAHLHMVKRGDSSFRAENVFSPSREDVEIALDLNLSPAKNAERYFARARKARQSLKDQEKHKEEYRDRYDEIITLLRTLEQIQTPDQWKEFAAAHAKEAGIQAAGAKEKAPVPFRMFTVDGGFEVWAGKSSENNDLLTTRHARPNDLWFHARGSGGSHVVLRVGTGKGELSRKAKEQAASIAAYYSKMKHSKLVPVAMTQKKYVHKRKGSPAGTVMVERETVLMVPPQLPAQNR